VVPREEQTLSLPSFAETLPHYPLFIKPVTEGSSKGIDGFNKVKEPAELERAVQELRSIFPDEDILVEPFLSGQELSVSILGTGAHSRVIGATEFMWQKAPSDKQVRNGDYSNLEFASRKSKSSDGHMLVVRNDPAVMADPQVKAACQVALDAWNALGCRDAGRVDIRFSSNEPDAVPNVLEVSVVVSTNFRGKRLMVVQVNPISGLLPGHSPLATSAEGNGLPYEKLLAAIIQSALNRRAACYN
jgi:D-alanine-D-alanine ligase-like ATP-grasp enzyme